MKPVSAALGGAILVVVGRLAATCRLPRNVLVGIRIPSTMRSDEAWRSGHLAAASALTVAGVGPVVTAVIAGVRRGDSQTEKSVLRIGTVWLVGWLILATVQANRAARMTNSAEGES
jgi:hypothetical protein